MAGTRVVLIDRDHDRLKSVSADWPEDSYALEEADVTKLDSLKTIAQRQFQSFGRIDYLFNNAGIGMAAEVKDVSSEDWQRIIQVNLFGVIHGIEAVYPIMVEQGFGHIINTGSLAGLVPLPCEAPYVASKYAVVGLSHTLRAEAAALGVQVSVVCPGVVRTPIYDSSPVVGFDKDKVMALWPKGLSAEDCARKILKGVWKNKGTIVMTREAHFLWRFHRLSPSLFLKAAVFYMKRLRRTRAQ